MQRKSKGKLLPTQERLIYHRLSQSSLQPRKPSTLAGTLHPLWIQQATEADLCVQAKQVGIQQAIEADLHVRARKITNRPTKPLVAEQSNPN
jgi:hypothetical protein